MELSAVGNPRDFYVLLVQISFEETTTDRRFLSVLLKHGKSFVKSSKNR